MDTISLNTFGPTQAPPSAKGGGGKTTLYIIVFFLCVISVMSGAFYFKMSQDASSAERKLKEIQEKTQSQLASAKSEEEKREIQRKSELQSQKAALEADALREKKRLLEQDKVQQAKFKAREAQIARAQNQVNSQLNNAAKKVREANNLKKNAQNLTNEAVKKKREADAAMLRAKQTNDANLKKLAEEKRRVAIDAAKKVRDANNKANAARQQAAVQAKNARAMSERLNAATAKLRGKTWEKAAAYNAVPGYPGGYWKEIGRNANPWVCAAWARQHGAHMWGHRGSTHPQNKWKNTCWAYKPGFRPKFAGNNDDVHLTGCSFGGHPRHGCVDYPKITMGEHHHLRGNRYIRGGNADVNYLGSYWNDRVSSIHVPHNTWLGVYEHGNYKGRGWGIRGPAYVPAIGWWNDRISSIRIRHF